MKTEALLQMISLLRMESLPQKYSYIVEIKHSSQIKQRRRFVKIFANELDIKGSTLKQHIDIAESDEVQIAQLEESEFHKND